jgi:hypothetical protein
MGQLVIPSRSQVYVDTSVIIYTFEENTDYIERSRYFAEAIAI